MLSMTDVLQINSVVEWCFTLAPVRNWEELRPLLSPPLRAQNSAELKPSNDTKILAGRERVLFGFMLRSGKDERK